MAENNWLIRTQMLLGEEGMERLKRARVAVFGIGGVGGYAARRWRAAAWERFR